MKRALCFGFGYGGHFLREPGGDRGNPEIPDGFPWTVGDLDGGLLKNRKVPDWPDGRVYWTCGGRFWFAFVWWDRSGDKRGASNSGFYVQGFEPRQEREAFKFACAKFPDVVARQLHPLVLVDLGDKEPTP